ncbi:MAG: signal peptidase I [Candidatus Obscuribacterales bacterium]|nr:signal peptidase I [Candidatus Obscuribacterales bacterium]
MQKPSENPNAENFSEWFKEILKTLALTLVLFVVIRGTIAEARYIPSSSMEPTLQISDRLIIEKVSSIFQQPIKRGDIVVFYPPAAELGGKDLSYDPLSLLGRLTGFPFLPCEKALIKRVVGLPGDRIVIQHGVGVYVNGELLDEAAYIKEAPSYDLKTLSDIGSTYYHPYANNQKPVTVPEGQLFVMGDNRNNSADSHVWGFLDQKRVIGRACLLFWRPFSGPKYSTYASGLSHY